MNPLAELPDTPSLLGILEFEKEELSDELNLILLKYIPDYHYNGWYVEMIKGSAMAPQVRIRHDHADEIKVGRLWVLWVLDGRPAFCDEILPSVWDWTLTELLWLTYAKNWQEGMDD